MNYNKQSGWWFKGEQEWFIKTVKRIKEGYEK